MYLKPELNFKDKSLKNFFLYSNQPMLVLKSDFQTILEINDIAVRTFGYSSEDVFLQPVEKMIPEKEQQKLMQLAATAKSAQQKIKKEISLISRSGKIIYTETVISSILYQGKAALLLTMTDITEKKLYRTMLEEAVEEEISLKDKNQHLKRIAYLNFHLARKPLANILGLVNVLDQATIADKTLAEAIEFLKESGHELDELIKGLDPQVY